MLFVTSVTIVLLSDGSAFKLHGTHVVSDGAPCTACHTSHGVPSPYGNRINNARLIDFDVSIVTVTPTGQRKYQQNGRRAGTCSLTCHGKQHDGFAY